MGKDKSVKNSSAKKRKQSSKKTVPGPVAKKSPLKEPSTKREDAMQETNDIPKFDLARQIMAEHRKITAVRRKGPAKNAKLPKKQHPAELITRKVMPESIVYGPEQIIAEIVARDIDNLCIEKTP
jgi:hypothetical protein